MSLDESGFDAVEAEPAPEPFSRPRRLRPANWNQMSLSERGLHDPDAPVVETPSNPGDVTVDIPTATLTSQGK